MVRSLVLNPIYLVLMLQRLTIEIPQAQPTILEDGRVRFELHAPGAGKVLLNGLGQSESLPMKRDSMGNWEVTLGPLLPDLYSYSFLVDGALTVDPQNPEVKKWRTLSSLLEIPGPNSDSLHAWRDVPHGAIHRHFYHSQVTGGQRSMLVYTPPAYQLEPESHFPVLYLLHGFGDDETAWTEVGRSHFIQDNLLSENRCRGMIVVMPNGHPLDIPPDTAFDHYAPDNLRAMTAEMRQEIMPYIKHHYRTLEGRDHRAIAGLSMGGGHALEIGLKHPELFGWVAGFSSAAPFEELDRTWGPLGPKWEAAPPKLLWMACGKEDFLLERNQVFVNWLEASGIEHQWHVSDGGHEWRVWRRYLTSLLPSLFQ